MNAVLHKNHSLFNMIFFLTELAIVIIWSVSLFYFETLNKIPMDTLAETVYFLPDRV